MAHLFSVKNDEQAEALLERDLFLRDHPELREVPAKNRRADCDARLSP